VKIVSTSGLTGAVYLVRTIFVALASTRLICCLIGQKGEFVRIVLVFFTSQSFSANYSFYTLQTTREAPIIPVARGPGGSYFGTAHKILAFLEYSLPAFRTFFYSW